MSNLDEVKKALRPQTKLAWVETPSNPLLKIVDLAAVAEIFHNAGALCICDNTWAPVLQRPFDLGADLILHSTTKYFGGHCDVAGGIVISKRDHEFFQRVRTIQYSGGAVPSPFDCWLILRGMRTLPWRMRAHSENATKVADFLAQHRQVEHVHYPGLHSHPGHEIAKRQMSMFGGMLSFEVTGGRGAAMSLAAKTKIFIRATSLGGVESLIEHRASIEGTGTTSPENLLRLSIGLENADDLIEDLNQALG
jgi:cystathionine gamma-synthase